MAGASILASLSSLRPDFSRLKSSAQTPSKNQQGKETPTADQDGVEVDIDGLEGNSTTNAETDKAAEVGAPGKNVSPECNQDAVPESGNVKLSGVNDLLRPFLRMLAPSSSCNLKLSKSICKQVLDEINEQRRDSQPASTLGASLRCALFREDILAGILDGANIPVSFENFPYYLRYILVSLNVRNRVIKSCTHVMEFQGIISQLLDSLCFVVPYV